MIQIFHLILDFSKEIHPQSVLLSMASIDHKGIARIKIIIGVFLFDLQMIIILSRLCNIFFLLR